MTHLDAQVDALMFLLQVAMLGRESLSVLSADIERVSQFSRKPIRMSVGTLGFVILPRLRCSSTNSVSIAEP